MPRRLLAGSAALLGLALAGALCPPAAQAAPAPDTSAAGLHISDGRLVEGDGADFVMRGVDHAHTWYPGQARSLTDIKALGATTVRVVLADGDRWSANGPADVAGVVDRCKADRLICARDRSRPGHRLHLRRPRPRRGGQPLGPLRQPGPALGPVRRTPRGR